MTTYNTYALLGKCSAMMLVGLPKGAVMFGSSPSSPISSGPMTSLSSGPCSASGKPVLGGINLVGQRQFYQPGHRRTARILIGTPWMKKLALAWKFCLSEGSCTGNKLVQVVWVIHKAVNTSPNPVEVNVLPHQENLL
jgi:hypothetical protein